MSTYKRKLRVFLCHASQDKPIVRELYQRLTLESWIDPWLDEEKLIPGIHWGMQIEKAVESADAVIVCLSNHSVTKEGYVQVEMKAALDYSLYKPEDTIFIIPLRLDACSIPWKIKSIQYIDYFPLDRVESAYKKLLYSLETRANLLGLDIAETKHYFQKEAEEKTQRELKESINKEAREKARREEEKILRQEAEERARIEIIEEARKLVREGKRKEAEEKVKQEKELIQKRAEELFKHDMELLKRKRAEDEADERKKELSPNDYFADLMANGEPRKSNASLGAGIVIVVLLCCFCIAAIGFWWFFGDQIMQSLNF